MSEIEIPDADPEGLVNMLEQYSRADAVSDKGGDVTFLTTIHESAGDNSDSRPQNVHRVMKDLHGDLDILQFGYIVTGCHQLDCGIHPEGDFGMEGYVHRVHLEPLAKRLVLSQYGYHMYDDKRMNRPPTKP